MDETLVRLLVCGPLPLARVGVALSVETVAVASAGVTALVAVFVHRWLDRSDREDSATPGARADDAADAWIGHLRSLVSPNITMPDPYLHESWSTG